MSMRGLNNVSAKDFRIFIKNNDNIVSNLTESTIDNIGRFKKMVESMVKIQADKIVQSKLSQGCYTPPSDSRRLNSDSMWDV